MPTLFPSPKEALVLELLATEGDRYGLELVALSEGALKRGTIYVTLARMQDKGMVKALSDQAAGDHAGMPRPRYRLTAQGQRALQACKLVRVTLRPERSPA
jgi:DNA-binding PadR family transcriptional regulator